MGITALLEVPNSLVIDVAAAQYEAVRDEGGSFTTKQGKTINRNNWYRNSLDQSIAIDGEELLAKDHIVVEKELTVANSDTKLSLHVYARTGFYGDTAAGPRARFITITLINRTVGGGYPRDEDCFYQCGVDVRGEANEECFLPYPEQRSDEESTAEEKALALLYRHRRVFAVGHGCAADWQDSREDESRSARIWSSTLPTYEIKPIQPSSLDGIDLSMANLAGNSIDEALRTCEELASRYESWIEEMSKEAEDEKAVPLQHREAARANLDACRECLRRIRRGIQLLESNETAQRAFTLMNHAMVMQHEHYQLATESALKRKWIKSSSGLAPDRPFVLPNYVQSKRQWRPFQLAFVLTTIRSIVLDDEEDATERDIVDLIWFPTGGGKTEAYLGWLLSPFSFAELSDPSNAGTTALMRYTLRLLTTQQYQRAASLICACEKLRRDEPSSLGDAPITIGLWVGGS